MIICIRSIKYLKWASILMPNKTIYMYIHIILYMQCGPDILVIIHYVIYIFVTVIISSNHWLALSLSGGRCGQFFDKVWVYMYTFVFTVYVHMYMNVCMYITIYTCTSEFLILFEAWVKFGSTIVSLCAIGNTSWAN